MKNAQMKCVHQSKQNLFFFFPDTRLEKFPSYIKNLRKRRQISKGVQIHGSVPVPSISRLIYHQDFVPFLLFKTQTHLSSQRHIVVVCVLLTKWQFQHSTSDSTYCNETHSGKGSYKLTWTLGFVAFTAMFLPFI